MFEDADISLLDFAEGEGQHKATFAASSTYCADVYYFRMTLRAIAAVAAHILVTAADRAAAHTLDHVGLKSAVRKLLRRRSCQIQISAANARRSVNSRPAPQPRGSAARRGAAPEDQRRS
jgi:hypothetical protein